MHSAAMTSHIRTATPDDVPAVREVIADSFAQYSAVIPPHVFSLYLDDLLDVTARMAGGGEVLVATAGDEVVGTVTFYDDGAGLGMAWPSGWSVFRALGVAPRRRAAGVGRALVTACVDRAAAAGADAVGLHTATFMTSAVELYERLGFRRQPAYDITPADVMDVEGDDLPTILAYRLDLTGGAPGASSARNPTTSRRAAGSWTKKR